MTRKTICLITLIILFQSFGLALDTLTLDDFITAAVQENPRYQISAREYLIALEQDKSVRSLEDWNLVANGIFTESSASSANTFSPTYQKVASYSLSAKRYFTQTGTEIKLEHSNTRMESKYPPISVPGMGNISIFPSSPYYLSDLSLSISQPLLRNAFGLASKNALKISDYSLKLAEIKLSEDWEDFIALLREEYLTWQKCHRNVELFQDKAKTVEDQLRLVEKQKKYGLSEELDLVQIKQKLQAYKIMLEQALLACENQTDRIIRLMGKRDLELTPQKFTKNGPVMKEKEAVSYLNTLSNVKKTTDIIVSIQKTNLETRENQKMMEVNLTLKTRPNAYTNEFSESLSRIGDYSENSVTLKASRPLFNQKAEAQAEEAENEYQKALKERENVMLNSEIGLSSLYTSLRYLDNMLELNQSNFKLAKERLALEKRKFDQGRSSVFFVLQAEDDVLMAENTTNETLFARESVINQIQSFTDRYLVEYEDTLKL